MTLKFYALYMNKIGLALSGGGALGVAHIGVIEVLEENNIKIDQISGTSAGSIIAAIYASGGLESLNQFFDEVSELEIFNQKKPFKIVTPSKFFDLVFMSVDKYCADNIEDTKIPLSVVATDIKTGELKIFKSGNTIEVIRASCAYPGVFPVQVLDGEFYIDGGTSCNLPTTPIKNSVNFLIGSNLYSLNELSEESLDRLNRAKVIIRSLDIMQRQIAEFYERECDFCFKISPNNLKWYSFNKIKSIREKGTEQARQQVSDLLRLNNLSI